MAIATCPKCATKLKVPDGTTASVRCPKCQTVFKTSAPPAPAAQAPAPAPPPPPPARQESPFENLDDDDDRPRKKSRRDDDEEDDRPRKKSRRDDDEEDNRPRGKKRDRDDDDDDDRPRKKSRRDDDEEDDRPRGKKRDRDDDDDDRPRKKRRDDDEDDWDKPQKSGSKLGVGRIGVMLVLISLGLYAGSMSLQALFIVIAFIGGVIPSGMGLVTGLMGLLNWIIGLVGLGLCIGGPSRSRGLAIAAISVATVHLVLCFVTANDNESAPSNISIPLMSTMNRASSLLEKQRELSKEESKNPGSARAKELREDLKSMTEDSHDEGFGMGGRRRSSMRWADFTTYLTYSDKLIAILSYESKGFSKSLLGIFSGLTELATLILISLMLGSMAGVVKHWAAQSKAKLGWIVAASTGGGAMIVMLLAWVIADSSKPDAKDFKADAPPNTSGMTFEQAQRAMEEYSRKQQDKMESAAKAPLRWFGVGELLCLFLHLGSVAMPAMAALAIFGATRSGGGGGRYKKRSRRDDDDD